MRRRRSLLLIGIALAILGACNAITGAHDRFLEETQPDDAGKKKDTSVVEPGTDANVIEPETDAGDAGKTTTTIEIPISAAAQWSSPNLATASFDGGTVISNFHAPHDNHPMLVPAPLPDVPATKYTVRGRIAAQQRAEYGIFVRGRNITGGFSVYVLSSRYSSGATLNEPFLAPLVTAKTDGTNDDPLSTGVANGPGYPFDVAKIWIFEVEVDGENLHGTITREDDPQIKSDMRVTDPTPAADRGKSFGFYGFGVPPASIIQLQLIY